MKQCNRCKKDKKDSKFRDNKLTCKKCEYRFWQRLLRSLVKQRRLTPMERLGNRLGYMGSAFIMMSPHLIDYGKIGYITYTVGALLSILQVGLAKQWNLVLINVNLLFGYSWRIFM